MTERMHLSGEGQYRPVG